MPKIVFVNRFFFPDVSATSQILTDLVRDLVSRDMKVWVLTGSQAYDNASVMFSHKDCMDGVTVTRIRTSRFGRFRLYGRLLDYLTFYAGAAWHLFTTVKHGDIIVAKTDPPLISVVAAAVAWWRGAILINWIQDLFPEVAESLHVLNNRMAGKLLRKVRNASLHRARWNVVIGNRMAERLESEGVPSHSIRIIPNWSNGQEIYPIDRPVNDLIVEWDLGGRFVVGYSGNMGRAHDFRTLLEAAELVGHATEIVFLLIGDGAQRPWIIRQAETRGLKNIVLKPYQPKHLLALSLSLPDIHLVSLHPELEGLIVPSKFYGIAAAGRPTLYVGDEAGEIPQLLTAHGCGWTVAPGQSSELAGRILELASDKAIIDAAGKNARQAFERNFDKPIAMQRWHSLFRETMELGASAAR